MAIQDNQKLDYLWKKLGYGVTKTDTNNNKLAANESITSPLLLRADKILTDANQIPSIIPASSTSKVTVYPTSSPVECTADNSASENRTWKTGITDWVSPEFGSTYLVKVYIHTSGDSAGAASLANQVFTTGSGNNDEWFFDYQSGVLHFIGDNLPSGKSFTGKSVYISGAKYSGTFGLSESATQGFSISELNDPVTNVIVGNTTGIIFDVNNGFILTDNGDGTVTVAGDFVTDLTDLNIADGNTGQVLSTDGVGNFQFVDHTLTGTVPNGEVFNIESGSQTSFTLATTPADAEAIDVYVDGVIQVPGISENYTLSVNTLTFSDAVPAGSEVYVKHRTPFATIGTVNVNSVTNAALNLAYTSHEYTGDGTTTDYTIQAEHTVHSVMAFIDGLIVSTSDYTIVGSTLSFTNPPANSSTIIFRYMPV